MIGEIICDGGNCKRCGYINCSRRINYHNEDMEVIRYKDLHPNSRNSTPVCPVCGSMVNYGWKFKHCPECGQALSWKKISEKYN